MSMIKTTLSSILLKFLSSWFPLSHLHIVVITIMFLVHIQIKQSLSSIMDPNFTACEPVNCGQGPNISYPFYITGKQKPLCGYPGFDLTCATNGFPILDLINNQYIIQQIFYNNNSIRVSNPAFSPPKNSHQCILPTQNLTVGKYRFRLAPKQRKVFLFYGCDLTKLPEEMKERRIGCSVDGNGTSNSSVVGLYEEDTNLRRLAEEKCRGGWVNTTVGDDDLGGNVREGLLKGFVLNWNASNCSTCSNSGGRCGFDTSSAVYAFRCFCPDRVHAAQCTTPPPLPPPGPRQPDDNDEGDDDSSDDSDDNGNSDDANDSGDDDDSGSMVTMTTEKKKTPIIEKKIAATIGTARRKTKKRCNTGRWSTFEYI
ncbi:hypothetical protein PIB30_063644 [Stylosanthes scabra]|uniref:non-specific serine/threonine protein kinase n=1 Tax=Stylosanthes scabra TaxID=79078 RepID=A0ABU6VLP1_9FABA|nr:hypothetical protein [Stylosanthes scabra]